MRESAREAVKQFDVELLADEVTKLCGALMVYDVTLRMVLALSSVPDFDFLKTQINAARDAYLLATDDESMVPLQVVPPRRQSHAIQERS